MNNTNSRSFFEAWLKAVEKRKTELLKVWGTAKEFTPRIIGGEDSVLSAVAHDLGLKSYEADYYSLDSILYLPEDRVPHIPENAYWFRDIRVAFEHENFFNSGLYKEVSHLLITRCDLRVLVSYPQRDTAQELSYLHEIISGTRQAQEISSAENFLIILGYEEGFIWEGMVYSVGKWKEIKIR